MCENNLEQYKLLCFVTKTECLMFNFHKNVQFLALKISILLAFATSYRSVKVYTFNFLLQHILTLEN